MNELLQKHGCSNVFSVPEGLKELMSDITREVLREQPSNIYDFISNYLSVMMMTREHGVMAVKILDDLCDCRPSISQHLIQLGINQDEASSLAEIIKEEIESVQPSDEGGRKESIKEYEIVKRMLKTFTLDEETTARVCQVARNAYRDYWYRKKTLEKSLKIKPEEPWEIAAQHTLELYKRTKPSISELTRATEKIQAAYRGYHVRRNLLRHLKPKKKKKGPKVALPGPPLDIAESREIELGPLLSIHVQEDDINAVFQEHETENLGLNYDPMKTITHLPDEDYEDLIKIPETRGRISHDTRPPFVEQSQAQRSRAPSVMTSPIPGGPRHSHVVAISSPKPSHIRNTDNTVLQKIAFAAVAPEVIPDESEEVVEDDHEIKEMLASVDGTDTEEQVDEVPEDIAESGDEAASAPSASLPSAHDTDEEGVLDTSEEEG